MKLQRFTFHCGQCGTSFEAPLMPVDAYGTFLLRSPVTGELACLDAQADKTYDEVDGLLKASPRLAGMKPGLRARLLQITYGEIACDVSAPAGV